MVFDPNRHMIERIQIFNLFLNRNHKRNLGLCWNWTLQMSCEILIFVNLDVFEQYCYVFGDFVYVSNFVTILAEKMTKPFQFACCSENRAVPFFTRNRFFPHWKSAIILLTQIFCVAMYDNFAQIPENRRSLMSNRRFIIHVIPIY